MVNAARRRPRVPFAGCIVDPQEVAIRVQSQSRPRPVIHFPRYVAQFDLARDHVRSEEVVPPPRDAVSVRKAVACGMPRAAEDAAAARGDRLERHARYVGRTGRRRATDDCQDAIEILDPATDCRDRLARAAENTPVRTRSPAHCIRGRRARERWNSRHCHREPHGAWRRASRLETSAGQASNPSRTGDVGGVC